MRISMIIAAVIFSLEISTTVFGSGITEYAESSYDVQISAYEYVDDNEYTYGNFKYKNRNEGTITITGYTAETGALTIPDHINGKAVTYIGDNAFGGKEGLTGDLIIPDTVIHIGEGAFQNCGGFNGHLVLPESLRGNAIEDNAFLMCSGLTGTLRLPSGLTMIRNGVFHGCKGFTGELIIPEGITKIGKYAFSGCTHFTGSLNIPDKVESIGDYAFENCRRFDGELNLPDSLKNLGEYAFKDCKSFKGDLRIPPDVGWYKRSQHFSGISEGAFYHCGFDGKLIVPSSIEIIDDVAFAYCRHFSGKLDIHSVKGLGASVFAYCSGFSSLDASACTGGGDDFVFGACDGMMRVTTGQMSVMLSRMSDGGKKWYDIKTKKEITKIQYGTAIREDYTGEEESDDKNRFTSGKASINAGEDVYTINWNTTVSFDGRKHGAIGVSVNEVTMDYKETAKKVSDIRVSIFKNGISVDPKCYSLKVKNNKNASVSSNGITSVHESTKKQPSIQVKFKGKEYKEANKTFKNILLMFKIKPVELTDENTSLQEPKENKDGSIKFKKAAYTPSKGNGSIQLKSIKLKYNKKDIKTDYRTTVSENGDIIVTGMNNYYGNLVFRK